LKIHDELEQLRVLSNDINGMNHPFSAKHKVLLSENTVQLIDPPEDPKLGLKPLVVNYSLPLALTEYVAKGTQLFEFDFEFLKNGVKKSDPIDVLRFARLVNYIAENAKGSITYHTMLSNKYFYEEVYDQISNEYRANVIVLIVDPLVILCLMIIFIPFILKVQTSLLKIYAHLCEFKEVEIKKWLDECNESLSIIKSSIKGTRKIYDTVSFEILIIDDPNSPEMRGHQRSESVSKISENQDAPNKKSSKEGKEQSQLQLNLASEEVNLKNTTNMRTTENGPEQKQEENEPLVLNEKALNDRKNKMFSRITRKKTKTYLVYLLILAASMGIFKTLDGILLNSVENKSQEFLNVVEILSQWQLNTYAALFFFIEELATNKFVSFYECIFLIRITSYKTLMHRFISLWRHLIMMNKSRNYVQNLMVHYQECVSFYQSCVQQNYVTIFS